MGTETEEIVGEWIVHADNSGQHDPYMFSSDVTPSASTDLLASAKGRRFGTILADPPWQFQNRTGKVAPAPSIPVAARSI